MPANDDEMLQAEMAVLDNSAISGLPPFTEPLNIEYDHLNDIVRIDGIDYSGGFFRIFADPDPEATYRIQKNGDGQVLITKL